ncbi:MAG TPA: type I-E CRISPR-associated protein Cse1/CasA [Chloroflexota bacterium]|nr:type I-E CRISPR-associated protein Cse1/CasA [Chloroflexota bacterium]
MSGFNLLDEPWIPCRRAVDGAPVELGIRDALVHAHEVGELFDPSPLVTASLHRLLLAVLQAAYGPPSVDGWLAHWRRERWDPEPLARYFAEHRSGFDLFDDERPFFQVLPDDDAKEHPIVLLAQERASGNNATLFDHSTQDTAMPVAPAEAARYLVAYQAYALGGGVSRPFYLSDGPLARGFSVMVQGSNLFETLALNWGAGRQFPRSGTDRPAWEWTTPRKPDKAGTRPVGLADYLTWQSRRVHLVRAPDEPRAVKGCRVQQNLSLPRDGSVLDPFKSYRKDKDRGWVPRSFSENRALWRDSSVLFEWSGDNSKRPDVFDWLAEVREDVGSRYSFSAYGVATPPGPSASVLLWRHERMPLPVRYLGDKRLVAALAQELERAEMVGSLFEAGTEVVPLPSGKTNRIRRPAQILAEGLATAGERQPTRGVVSQILAMLQLDRGYWARLETPFRSLLVGLPTESTKDEDGLVHYGTATVRPAWHSAIRRAARESFDDATRGLERTASSRGWKAISEADLALRTRLSQLLPKPTIEEDAA